MIKLLIADDHPIVRRGLATLLNAEADIDVIGEASDGLEVIDLLRSGISPDVIVTDLKMPNLDGIRLTLLLAAAFPAVKVIILTVRTEQVFKEAALRAGAKGYLIKLEVQEPRKAIRLVFAGSTYF